MAQDFATTTLQLTQLRIDLRTAEENEIRLRRRLAETQESICNMRIRAKELEEMLKTAYISRLPHEVISEIFVGVCANISTPPDSVAENLRDIRRSPELVVSQVSRRWRAVAIGTRSLWANIRLYSGQSQDLLAMYHERCGQHLLRIQCVHPLGHEQAESTRISKFIVAAINQCRSLNVWFPPNTCQFLFPQIRDLRAPFLQELTLVDRHFGVSQLPLFTKGLPSLLSAELQGVDPTSLQSPSGLSLVRSLNLSQTTLRDMEAAAFVGFLQSLPSLSSLTLDGDPVNFQNGSTPFDVITLPSLQSLHIITCFSDSLYAMTSNFRTPSLKHLTIDWTRADYPGHRSDWVLEFRANVAAFSPWNRQIESLAVYDNFQSYGDILLGLSLVFPNITRLTLSSNADRAMEELMVRHFREKGGEESWSSWEKLKTLVLNDSAFSRDILLNLLRSRKSSGCPIGKVIFPGSTRAEWGSHSVNCSVCAVTS
ncbi:hypothetical protein BV22DRAFT_95991 [Leucogyrophana mollusca]|uniref:Uncharacterized protein n=1 Tax=Leucogyrophana mollusca TaxID=85980 RepID=A0ACB8BXV1_9AGAM|nr:hypothetical protein BV22DRAFT_95991 [Leucogyrophana mollusca]